MRFLEWNSLYFESNYDFVPRKLTTSRHYMVQATHSKSVVKRKSPLQFSRVIFCLHLIDTLCPCMTMWTFHRKTQYDPDETCGLVAVADNTILVPYHTCGLLLLKRVQFSFTNSQSKINRNPSSEHINTDRHKLRVLSEITRSLGQLICMLRTNGIL